VKALVVLLALTTAAAADPAPSGFTAAVRVGGGHTGAGKDTSRAYGFGLSFDAEAGGFLTDRLAGLVFARAEPTFGTHQSNGDQLGLFKVYYGARFHAYVLPTVFAGAGICRLDQILNDRGAHDFDSALAIEAHVGAVISHMDAAVVDTIVEIGRAHYADPDYAVWGRFAVGIRW